MKYKATFYWRDRSVKIIERNNKKHLMSAVHRWTSNQVQLWDKIIIERKE